jgi:murein DD-endopeptidase MepM/ murein hydrolase activator NlpD
LPVNQYKKVEKEYADRIGAWFRRILVTLANFFKTTMIKGKQRFTVMLIPHSEKKIFNFQISFFTLIFATFFLSIILVGFVLLATHFSYTNDQNTKLSESVGTYEKTLHDLRDQVAVIKAASKHLVASIDEIVQTAQKQDSTGGGSVASISANFPSIPSDSSTNADQLVSLRAITQALQTSSDSLDQYGKSLQLFQDLFASTPTTWPLKDGVGNITTRFGWTTNPFTKVGYLHTGVDIAWAAGTPVLATADGKVVQTGYTEDFGNFVLIQHKYGFYTRYAHLSRIARGAGTSVKRGDIIGAVGSTGLSTGPHLHYEVRLGSQYINPIPFLDIKGNNTVIGQYYGRSGD